MWRLIGDELCCGDREAETIYFLKNKKKKYKLLLSIIAKVWITSKL